MVALKAVANLTFVALVTAVLVGGCASSPPKRQADLCAVFEQYPDWYDYARASAKKWGTPVHIQMAFVRHESSYRATARPPRKWFLFIPLGRASSAKGYAQARTRCGVSTRRSGAGCSGAVRTWKTRSTSSAGTTTRLGAGLGIPRTDAYRLYLAYHEGRGGYSRGSWKKKPRVCGASRSG